MEKSHIFSMLPGALLPWYQKNHRDLPWRKDKDPYHIWVSEIMLQQTRVEAVKGYYARFLEALPTIAALANADDEQLHKLWEGLGYYSRVRNLKKAAQQIMEWHNGVFPQTYAEVSKLSGIGPYTSGAICSIAFDLPTPAVDGNVLRVVSRLTDDTTPIDDPKFRKQITDQLAHIYPAQAGDFTQALMELGATVCGPNRKPDCENCPCREFCLGNLRGTAQNLPVKAPKKQRREENLTVFILSCDGKYALEKRPDTGLLAGLWQFPNIAGHFDTQESLKKAEALGLSVKDILRQTDKKHIFTHIQWNMRGIYIEVSKAAGNYVWLTPKQIEKESALPTAFRQFWEDIEHI